MCTPNMTEIVRPLSRSVRPSRSWRVRIQAGSLARVVGVDRVLREDGQRVHLVHEVALRAEDLQHPLQGRQFGTVGDALRGQRVQRERAERHSGPVAGADRAIQPGSRQAGGFLVSAKGGIHGAQRDLEATEPASVSDLGRQLEPLDARGHRGVEGSQAHRGDEVGAQGAQERQRFRHLAAQAQRLLELAT